MEIWPGYQSLEGKLSGSVVTIGNFDGVHRGHQKIIQRVRDEAQTRGVPSVVFTFRPHPLKILRPKNPLYLLTSYQEKAKRVASYGIDHYVEESFDSAFARVEAKDFFKGVLLDGLKAQVVIVGHDFAFGKDRRGSLDLLREQCSDAGVELVVQEAFELREGERVSSSLIRNFLQAGEVDQANHQLGYQFEYQGSVQRGEGRGRKIGFPTANLFMGEKIRLANGVYVSITRVGEREYPSVTNIGVRPTFDSSASDSGPLVESHLLDVDMDLYDQEIAVRFLTRVREERRFSGVEPLKTQIRQDVAVAREHTSHFLNS